MNGCARGRRDFDPKSLENHKARRTPMLCKACRDVAERQRKENDQREARLLKILKQRDAWKCTCRKKMKVGTRAHAALNEPHGEKCLLAPSYMGGRRWDGKNVGVSREDLKFLDAREHKKW